MFLYVGHRLWTLGVRPHLFQRFWIVRFRKKASWQQGGDHREAENKRRTCCRFCSGNPTKLDLLPHAWADKEVSLLVRPIHLFISTSRSANSISFDINSTEHFQTLNSAPLWLVTDACQVRLFDPHIHVRFLISVSLQHNWFYKHNRDELLIYLTNYAHLPCVFSCPQRREDVLRSVHSWYHLITL